MNLLFPGFQADENIRGITTTTEANTDIEGDCLMLVEEGAGPAWIKRINCPADYQDEKQLNSVTLSDHQSTYFGAPSKPAACATASCFVTALCALEGQEATLKEAVLVLSAHLICVMICSGGLCWSVHKIGRMALEWIEERLEVGSDDESEDESEDGWERV